MAKNSRRNRRETRKNRKNRKNSRRQNRRRTMYGGQPAPVNDTSMQGPESQSLAQGNQFAAINKNFHGGAALVGGPYPSIITDPTILPESLRASARVLPLDGAIAEVSGMKDPGTVMGGGRRRKSRKNRKANRKNRKASRKANRKNRKATRKSRKNRKNRRNYRGGAYSLENAGSFSMTGSDMLLPPAQEAKALQGMNSEWKLAENPQAFAPGYKSY